MGAMALCFLEIQEGKDAMRRAQFRKEMGAGAACAMRVGLGAVGQRLEGAGEENIFSL